jgi:hypothetical protein
VSGTISKTQDIFELLLVFPEAYQRAAYLTLSTGLFFEAFPREFRAHPSPNLTVSGWRADGGRDHTESWVQALIMSKDELRRMEGWPNRPPPVYIGAGLVQVLM